MKVYFIGAGPGAADLITMRGARLLGQADIVLYAGSLVPQALLDHCSAGAQLIDTSTLTLEDQIAHYVRARDKSADVARLHSGDPTIFGAIAEQIDALKQLSIQYEIIPGVSSFTASAASLGCSLTKPEIGQSIILTRLSGRASSVPEFEKLETLAALNATMCIFLSGAKLEEVINRLCRHYPGSTPIALVQRAGQPTERQHIGTLDSILAEIKTVDWQLTTTVLVGNVLGADSKGRSKLYDPAYQHRFRKQKVISTKDKQIH